MGFQEKLVVEGRHLLLVFGWVPLGKEPAIFASPGASLVLGCGPSGWAFQDSPSPLAGGRLRGFGTRPEVLFSAAEAPQAQSCSDTAASMQVLGIVTSAVPHTERWASCPHLSL